MFTQTGQAVISLANLNAALAALTNVLPGAQANPLTAASFNAAGNPSAAEIDQAVAAANDTITEWVELDGLVDSVNAQLAYIVADPAGYELWSDAGFSAYVRDGYGCRDDDAGWKQLVSAAHYLGNSRHQTTDARSAPATASAYVHSYATNHIYAFTDDGLHRTIPMVTTVASGRVNSGEHVFTS
jgi:hypothetical protein